MGSIVQRRFAGAALVGALAWMLIAASGAEAAGTLTVSKSPSGSGTVTGTIPTRSPVTGVPVGPPTTVINCGSDCSEDVGDYETCTIGTDPVCTEHTETVTLSSSPAAGWALQGWTGCSSVSGGGNGQTCERTMPNSGTDPVDRSVTANYADVGPPTVSLSGPVDGSKLNGSIGIGATAADNAGVQRVRFFINGIQVAEDSNGSDGWSATFSTSPYSHNTALEVRARAFDAAGNISDSAAADERNYVVDRHVGAAFTSPTPAPGAWVGTDDDLEVAFAKDATDAPADNVTFRCRINGGSFASCSSPLSESSFPTDGNYTVDVEATDDAAPTANVATISRSFKVDRTAPSVALTRPAQGSEQPAAFTPEFSVTELNAGPVACSLDGGAYGACGALAGLSAGAHSFSVRAADQAGNETVVTNAFSVAGGSAQPPGADTAAPDTRIDAAPKRVVKTKKRKAKASFSFSSTETGSSFECDVDSSGFKPCGSPQAYKLGKGSHVFQVRAVDAAGNADPSPATATWKVKRKPKK